MNVPRHLLLRSLRSIPTSRVTLHSGFQIVFTRAPQEEIWQRRGQQDTKDANLARFGAPLPSRLQNTSMYSVALGHRTVGRTPFMGNLSGTHTFGRSRPPQVRLHS